MTNALAVTLSAGALTFALIAGQVAGTPPKVTTPDATYAGGTVNYQADGPYAPTPPNGPVYPSRHRRALSTAGRADL